MVNVDALGSSLSSVILTRSAYSNVLTVNKGKFCACILVRLTIFFME
jgi:hypothetical protein